MEQPLVLMEFLRLLTLLVIMFTFFQREGLPLIAGGGSNLTNPGSFYPNLVPGKARGPIKFCEPRLASL